MVDFSQVQQQAVPADATAQYKMYGISINGKHPTLTVKPANEINKPYFNARLKKTAPRIRSMRAGNAIDAAMLEETRNEDRELFPKYVVTGWADVCDPENPEGTPFNQSNCADFINALPDDQFDDLRQFCENTFNFRPDAPNSDDVDALAGN